MCVCVCVSGVDSVAELLHRDHYLICIGCVRKVGQEGVLGRCLDLAVREMR